MKHKQESSEALVYLRRLGQTETQKDMAEQVITYTSNVKKNIIS